MEGYKLNKGQLKLKKLSEDQIWSSFKFLFSPRSKNQSSYKFGFLRALTDSLYNLDKQQLPLRDLFNTFTKIYWNLVVQHGLRQTDKSHNASSIEIVLKEFKRRHNLPEKINFDKLPLPLQAEISEAVFRIGKRYVVGAIYGDTKGLFYSFDLKTGRLRLSPSIIAFLKKHKDVIFKLNNYEFTKFLLRNNEQLKIKNLLQVVENITKRKILTPYKKALSKFESDCFYCNKPLARTKTHVDHFIPWSTVTTDNLWNLVLSCSKCNQLKNDRIPHQRFLKKLISRNSIYVFTSKDSVYQEAQLVELYKYSRHNTLSALFEPIEKRR